MNQSYHYPLETATDSNGCQVKCTDMPKGLLKVKTVNTKKYGREAMTNNAVSSWNNIQKIFSSRVLLGDLSYSKLKSLPVKYFLKSYSNNA